MWSVCKLWRARSKPMSLIVANRGPPCAHGILVCFRYIPQRHSLTTLVSLLLSTEKMMPVAGAMVPRPHSNLYLSFRSIYWGSEVALIMSWMWLTSLLFHPLFTFSFTTLSHISTQLQLNSSSSTLIIQTLYTDCHAETNSHIRIRLHGHASSHGNFRRTRLLQTSRATEGASHASARGQGEDAADPR